MRHFWCIRHRNSLMGPLNDHLIEGNAIDWPANWLPGACSSVHTAQCLEHAASFPHKEQFAKADVFFLPQHNCVQALCEPLNSHCRGTVCSALSSVTAFGWHVHHKNQALGKKKKSARCGLGALDKLLEHCAVLQRLTAGLSTNEASQLSG